MSARLFGGALLAALVFAPPAAAGVTKQTFRVPVSAPDEHGAKVALDTDVYMPEGRAPPRGRPFVVVFHGGGSNKDSGFDAGHAKAFAEHGYVSLLYSQRGHGSSSGQTAVAGPKEMRDVFDVIHWALARPAFHVDRMRIGLTGYSQGGLHTNLAQVWASDRRYNPYGIRFRALEPADTPDRVFEALDTHDVVKLSFGVALLETYLVGTHAQMAPVVGKWIGTVAADQPQLFAGDVCQDDVHDTSTSSIKADLAFRSVGCHDSRMKPPIMWAQAFDDTLFTADMAISMYERMPSRDKRLYLDMAGHAAPAASDAELASKLRDQIRSDPKRRRRVEPMSGALTDALKLAELRDSKSVSQKSLAATLAVSQANVSRIEHEEDVYLSTLRRYVEALGGQLEITATFGDEHIRILTPA